MRRADPLDPCHSLVLGGDELAVRPRIRCAAGHIRGRTEQSAMTGELPGDLPAREKTERMIRVDHAGEYGATRIYAGQLAVLGRSGKGNVLRHMQAQEEQHLRTFNDRIADRRVRPTALLPIWHVAGFALGAMTAALGEKAAMACTVAVEEAIDAHYSAQLETMDEAET